MERESQSSNSSGVCRKAGGWLSPMLVLSVAVMSLSATPMLTPMLEPGREMLSTVEMARFLDRWADAARAVHGLAVRPVTVTQANLAARRLIASQPVRIAMPSDANDALPATRGFVAVRFSHLPPPTV